MNQQPPNSRKHKDHKPVHVQAIRPPRFEPTDPQLSSFLEEHGFVVVASVASSSSIEHSKDLFWRFLCSVPNTTLRRDDPSTWVGTNWLPSELNGIISGFGFGQSDFMWHLRLLPRVKTSFASIWETDDLLVSFDGGNAFRPWQRNNDWITDGGWYHVDQNYYRPKRQGRVCVQGLVTLTDANESTGGLVVVPGSHKEHRSMCERIPIAKAVGDYVPIPLTDPVLAHGSRLICAKAGDLILWDSRTVHCNTPAITAEAKAITEAAAIQVGQPQLGKSLQLHPIGQENEQSVELELPHPRGQHHEQVTQTHDDLIRLVGYVCMTPTKYATPEVLEKRKQAFVDHTSTSHWPHAFVMSGVGLPDAVPNDFKKVSLYQRQLIGYNQQKQAPRVPAVINCSIS